MSETSKNHVCVWAFHVEGLTPAEFVGTRYDADAELTLVCEYYGATNGQMVFMRNAQDRQSIRYCERGPFVVGEVRRL